MNRSIEDMIVVILDVDTEGNVQPEDGGRDATINALAWLVS